MSQTAAVGVLIPDDGPDTYEWHSLEDALGPRSDLLPPLRIAGVPSDGHHEPAALHALGDPDRLAAAAGPLCEAGCSALMWACTSGSFIEGLDWAMRQAESLGKRTGIPASSTSLAFRQALGVLGIDRVDLLGTYPEAVTQALADFLADCGVIVGAMRALDCACAADSHTLDIVGEAQAFRAERGVRANPMLIPDTAINSLRLAGQLCEPPGPPVITANQVTLWQALKMVGCHERLACLGALAGKS